jgi:hypothetical protein
VQRNLAVGLDKVADVLTPSGSIEDALAAYRESLEIRRILRAKSDNPCGSGTSW